MKQLVILAVVSINALFLFAATEPREAELVDDKFTFCHTGAKDIKPSDLCDYEGGGQKSEERKVAEV